MTTLRVFLFVGAFGLVAVACGSTATSTDAGAPGADAGGGGSCPPECLRAVECRRGSCAGPVVSLGCCGCGPGDVDARLCEDASTDAGDDARPD